MRALHGNTVSFDKVINMVDDMVTLLGKEQVDDGSQKDMCEISIDNAEDTCNLPSLGANLTKLTKERRP